MIKKIWICLIAILLFVSPLQVNAQTINDLEYADDYSIVAIEGDMNTVLFSAKTYKNAEVIYNREVNNYNNLAIVYQGKVLKVEYGIVQINSTSSCDYNVEFKNSIDNGSNYVNGCYGIDAAYLNTNAAGNKVEMMISGVAGWANMSDVTIIPLEMLPARISTYIVKEGSIYHQIKQSFNNDLYAALINVGSAPSYLEQDVEYYSYDGHYFYRPENLLAMLDDYRASNRSRSINPNEPYYNYYQYVSHRTLTNVTVEEITDYIRNTLQIKNQITSYLDMDKDSSNDTLNRSQFYDEESAFFQYQYQYGANALMMLGLSMNETAIGRSSLSFTRNNLFGHAAYDSDVEKNASRYFNVMSSIYSHAKYYISASYANPFRFQFHGSYFGNKANGMNGSYASDPYWGEKAAQFYMQIDAAFGYKDNNSMAIGIKTTIDDVKVYQYDSTSSAILYSTGKQPDFAFVILDAFSNSEGDWYKVQSEATLNEESKVDMVYYYNYLDNVGYIKQSDVQLVMNPEKMGTKEMIKVSFDANGGNFQDESVLINYLIEVGRTPVIENPKKDKAIFVGWDKEITAANEEITYVAQYEPVDSIEMGKYPVQLIEWNDRINIDGGTIVINYANGKQETVPLTTSMISGYDLKTEGEQEVLVSYAGNTTSYKITVDKELDTVRQELKAEISAILDEMSNLETLTEEQAKRVLDLKVKMDNYMVPYLTQPQLRALDKLIYMAIDHRINYVIYENDLDASVSGLSLSIDLGDSLENKILPDTIKLVVKNSINKEHEAAMKLLAEGNSLTFVDSFKIQTQKNLNDFELNTPVLISIKKPEGSSNNQLFTVLLYEDGEIIKCYTKQTNNYIQFMTPAIGEFMILSRNTTNDYTIDDVVETVRVDNSDPDIPALIAAGLFVATIVLLIVIAIDALLRKRKRKKLRDQQENTIEDDPLQSSASEPRPHNEHRSERDNHSNQSND